MMAHPMPLARALTGNSPFAHLRDMRNNLIAYLEHLARQGDLLRINLGLASAYFINQPDAGSQMPETLWG